jgi:hypothetical protein
MLVICTTGKLRVGTVIEQLSILPKEKPGEHHTIAFDLQQTFPTPRQVQHFINGSCGPIIWESITVTVIKATCLFGVKTKQSEVLMKLEVTC